MKKESIKGITLVALVVTIIILLILAGVAITALTQTGLFENAKQAKNAMENAQILEELTLNDYNNKIVSTIDGTRNIKENNINYDIIYSGEANKVGVYNFIFPTEKNLSNYKYLIFYANAFDSDFSKNNSDKVQGKTEIVPAEVTVGKNIYDLSHWTKWYILFSIPNETSFSIDSTGYNSRFFSKFSTNI